MNIGGIIKAHRTALGLSQSRLAHEAGLSLPLVQKLEAGTGNPSWNTLQEISKVIGVEVQIVSSKAPWEDLAYLGAPLSSTISHKNSRTPKTINLLVRTLSLCCQSLIQNPHQADYARLHEATQAMILALMHSYPKLWKLNFHRGICSQMIPSKITGRHIKLKRIAKENLSKYL